MVKAKLKGKDTVMLFKLKKEAASHRDENRRVYEAGDTVESEFDLAKMWPTKFDLISGSAKQTDIPTAPSIPAPAKTDGQEGKGGVEPETTPPKSKKKKGDEEKESAHGKDVTADFPSAKGVGFKIYEKGNWFTVVDANDGEKMNEKALRKKDVQTFLDKFAAAPDDSEDNEDDDKDDEDDEDES